MKKLFFPLLLLSLFSSCSHEVYRSLHWQQTRVTPDGGEIEWPGQMRFLDDKTRITYDISNDRRNLYICLSVSDLSTKMKIIHGGMEFRIDTLGKKVFPVTFGFPIPGQMVVTREMRAAVRTKDSDGERQVTPVIRQKVVNPATDARLAGFKPQFNGTVSLINNTSGISAALNIDSLDVLSYEAVIPFSTFYKDELTPADTSRAFTYEIKINAMPAPKDHEGTGGGEGRRVGGGMGGKFSAGMGGGMGGANAGGSRGQQGGRESSGSRPAEHRENGPPPAGDEEMYVARHIINKMRFSVK